MALTDALTLLSALVGLSTALLGLLEAGRRRGRRSP